MRSDVICYIARLVSLPVSGDLNDYSDFEGGRMLIQFHNSQQSHVKRRAYSSEMVIATGQD